MKKYASLFFIVILLLVGINPILAISSFEQNAIVAFDLDTNTIICNKNPNMKIYPASTTKLMTTILVLEKLNLNTNITISKNAITSVPQESSTMYLKIGETLTVEQLLYGLLLSSGNDAANVLAEATAGSITNFVYLMNLKAKELGCKNTHFANAHGFHDEKHYSTAYDMALMMKYAVSFDEFKEIAGTKTYTIESTEQTKQRVLKNTNTLLTDDEHKIIGKTGYTPEAGNTFISYSETNNFITALFNSPNSTIKRESVFQNCKSINDYVTESLTKQKLIDKETFRFPYFDSQQNILYEIGIDKDIYCLKDNNLYSLAYTLKDINIDNNTLKGKIFFEAKNENWSVQNNADLVVLKQEYQGPKMKDNNLLLFILAAILVIMLIVGLHLLKKKKRMIARKKKLSKNR